MIVIVIETKYAISVTSSHLMLRSTQTIHYISYVMLTSFQVRSSFWAVSALQWEWLYFTTTVVSNFAVFQHNLTLQC